jgi:two-component system, NarL family, nitrate/nitrite response regulator NarL
MGHSSGLVGAISAPGSDASLGIPESKSDREGHEVHETAPDVTPRPRILILSDIRFIREALAEILGRERTLSIIGVATDLDEARAICQESQISVVLVDTTLPDGLAAVDRIKVFAPDSRVVALGLAETNENVIAWAEAGVAGYVPRSAGLVELVAAISGVMRGEQLCTASVAAGLLRRLATRMGHVGSPPPAVADSASLTTREVEIARLLAEGLSDKEVARRLGVALSTSKSHVHNLLQKLCITRRGQVGPRLRRYEAELPKTA